MKNLLTIMSTYSWSCIPFRAMSIPKRGPWANSINITWELVRNTNARAPSQVC